MTVVTTIEDLTEAWLAHLSVARDPAMIAFDQQDRPWIVWETEDGDMCAASYPSEDDPHIVPGERVHPPLVDAETLLPLQVPLTGPQRPLVSLSDEDLHRPYSYYQPGSPQTAEVIGWIVGNSYEHYDEHRPWIEAILGRTG